MFKIAELAVAVFGVDVLEVGSEGGLFLCQQLRLAGAVGPRRTTGKVEDC